MHLNAHPGRIAAGLATFATLASLGGTAAVVATRTGSAQGQHAHAVAPAAADHVTRVAADPTVTQRPTMPSSHPLGAAARPAGPAGPARPLTPAQAVALAEARTRAHVDEVEALTGPLGMTYDVKLVRADGSDVEVLVVARTGQVSGTDEQDQAAQALERPQEYEPVPNEPSPPSDAPDQ